MENEDGMEGNGEWVTYKNNLTLIIKKVEPASALDVLERYTMQP